MRAEGRPEPRVLELRPGPGKLSLRAVAGRAGTTGSGRRVALAALSVNDTEFVYLLKGSGHGNSRASI